MLMQQKAAEHHVKWTNFRSAWPRFITAHKPKVSCIRLSRKSVTCCSRIIYQPKLGFFSPSLFPLFVNEVLMQLCFCVLFCAFFFETCSVMFFQSLLPHIAFSQSLGLQLTFSQLVIFIVPS